MKSDIKTVIGKFVKNYKSDGLLVDEKRVSERAMLNTLKQFGIKVDKNSLLKAGENIMSIEEAFEVLSENVPPHIKDSMKFDVAFMYVMELWRRWYPDRVTFEMLQVRLENVTGLLENDNVSAAARVWFKTWPVCLEFFDKHNITSAAEYRSRYPRYQEILDSILIIAEELAERGGRLHYRDARISCYEQLLSRLAPESELDELTNGILTLLADAYMTADRADMVDELFEKFLKQNPTWSNAWCDWHYCYLREGTPEKIEKAENILQRAMKTLDARDEIFDPELHEHKKSILITLAQFFDRFDRSEECKQVMERLEEEYPDEDPNEAGNKDWDYGNEQERRQEEGWYESGNCNVESEQKFDLGVELQSDFSQPTNPEVDPDKLTDEERMELLQWILTQPPRKKPLIGKQEPCPCYSGEKFKRCCGSTAK